MKSRFLIRIEEQAELAGDPAIVLCFALEKASYLARRGDYVESASIVQVIRERGQHLLDGNVGAWINFAEGMQFHCSGKDHEAKLKWSRCLAIARSVNATQVAARASAWLAFIDYTTINIPSLIGHIKDAVIEMRSDNYEATARVNLTIAQLFHLCGDIENARPFYDKARLACISCFDDVMLAALIHNMAWLRVSAQRNAVLQGLVALNDGHLVEAAVESTRSYESLIGSKVLDVMTPLLGAQVDILLGRCADAIRVISEKIDDLRDQGLSRLTGVLFADRAYCHAQTGELEKAQADALAALEAVSVGDHVDDLAVLYSRLSSVYEILGNLEKSNEYRAKATCHWEKFKKLQNSISLSVNEAVGFNP